MTRGRTAAWMTFVASLTLFSTSCSQQNATLTGDYLIVSPCKNGRPLEMAPVDMSFDRIDWMHNTDAAASLDMRQGWREPSVSNAVILQITNLPAVVEAWRLSPGTPISMDGVARVALALQASCPEALQPLVATTGTLTITQIDLLPSGRIAGKAQFDIIDERADPSDAPVGQNLTLTFAKDLNDKDPLTGWGR